MATKLDRVGIYNEELPSIRSQGPLIMWSYKVMGKIRPIGTKIDRVVTYYEKLPPVKSQNPLTREFT